MTQVAAGFIRTSDVASGVCLALMLLVYNTLPSLQNSCNYCVKSYMAVELVAFLCVIIKRITEDIKGYFTLFTFLASICWLNVICFDIYWILRIIHTNRLISAYFLSLRVWSGNMNDTTDCIFVYYIILLLYM